MLGGFNQAGELNDDQMEVLLEVQPLIVARLNKGELAKFVPISVKQQVVAGMIFWFKLQIDNDEVIHVKVFKPLPYTQQPCEVQEIQEGKTLDDPL